MDFTKTRPEHPTETSQARTVMGNKTGILILRRCREDAQQDDREFLLLPNRQSSKPQTQGQTGAEAAAVPGSVLPAGTGWDCSPRDNQGKKSPAEERIRGVKGRASTRTGVRN